MLLSGESTTDLPPLHIQWCTLQAQLDDGLVEFSSISSDASVDQLMAGFLKLAHGAHTEDQVIQHIQHIFMTCSKLHQTSRPIEDIEGFKDLSDLQFAVCCGQ